MVVAFIGYFNKEIDFKELMTYVTIVGGIYGVVEGVPDALAAIGQNKALIEAENPKPPENITVVDEDRIANKVVEKIRQEMSVRKSQELLHTTSN